MYIYIHITYINLYIICNIYIYILYTHIKEFLHFMSNGFNVEQQGVPGEKGKPPDRKSPEAGGFSKAQRTGASWVKLEHSKNLTSMDWLTLPILDTLQKK